MKILHLDIETAPNDVHVWGLFRQNVSIKQVLASGYTLCWAAKWDDKRPTYFNSIKKTSRRQMVEHVHELIDEADAIVHYNGTRFDMPTLNWEFLKLGLAPPSPYDNIDLYLACRRKFKAASLKLDFVVNELGLGGKTNHKGHQLWIDCMRLKGVSEADYLKAWRVMERYNKQDVVLTERLYHELLPWITTHPNRNVFNNNGDMVCVTCGSTHLQKRGTRKKRAGMYQQYQCQSCSRWMTGTRNILDKETRRNMVVGAN